ncbi:MAG TPA: aldo/keto reductase [Pseudolabrys sp.]|nr:aldo/keto reductase [Pseudolabrys sp.]
MKRRNLGTLEVSAIALGAPVYDVTTDQEIDALVTHAFGLGIDLLDTSDAYQGGRHEASLGRVLKGRRDKAVIATKFGNLRDKDGKPAGVNGRPDYVVAACERSLKTLAIDTIDLYYIHRVDPDVPIEETVGAMASLKTQGKIRHLGICEAAPATLRRAHAVHPISALQTEYSLWSRDPEGGLLDLCAELNIGFVAYSPLGRGFLTSTVTGTDALQAGDLRRGHPRFQADNAAHNRELVARMNAVAERHGCTPAQLALAWLLRQREFIVPVPGTRRVAYLEDNAGADEVALSDDAMAELDRIFAPGAVAGERYPPGLLARVNI